MDIFVEQLVKKKRETKDFLMIIGLIAAALVVLYLLAAFMSWIPFFAYVILIAVFIMIYGLYNLITSVNLEYEYCFTNGALDVDKIINLRKRQRLTELNAKEIEIMARITDSRFDKYFNNPVFKKIYACADKKSSDTYFIIYNENGIQKMLLFTPNAEIKDGFKKFNPQKIEL